MSEYDGIKRVYTGSLVEAEYIVELLDERGIGAMIKNPMDETIPMGLPETSVQVFVAEHDYAHAFQIIEQYKKSAG